MVLFLFFCTSNGLALDASARNHPGLPLFGVEDMVQTENAGNHPVLMSGRFISDHVFICPRSFM